MNWTIKVSMTGNHYWNIWMPRASWYTSTDRQCSRGIQSTRRISDVSAKAIWRNRLRVRVKVQIWLKAVLNWLVPWEDVEPKSPQCGGCAMQWFGPRFHYNPLDRAFTYVVGQTMEAERWRIAWNTNPISSDFWFAFRLRRLLVQGGAHGKPCQ